MAGDAPTYLSELRLPGADTERVQGLAPPPDGGIGRIGEAVAKLAGTALDIRQAQIAAREHTEVAEATTRYLTRQYQLETSYADDQEFKTAPERFQTDLGDAAREQLGTISNPRLRARAQLEFTRTAIASHKRVKTAAFSRETDTNLAALDSQGLQAARDADAAGSAVERGEAAGRYRGAVESAVAAGYLSQRAGVERLQSFNNALDRGNVMRAVRTHPVETRLALDDPKQYPNLSPIERETYKNHAANLADQTAADRARVAAASGDIAGAREILTAIEQPHQRAQAERQLEADQRAAAAEADRRIAVAATAARTGDDVVDLVKQGFEVAPQRIEQVRSANVAAALRGDAAAAKYVRELDGHLALQPFIRRAWATSPLELDNAIKGMEASLTSAGADATPEQANALKAFKQVREQIATRRTSEPITLGGQYGARYYRLEDLNPQAAAEDPGLRAELARRSPHALFAAELYGGKASVFTAEEGARFKDRFAAASPDEKFRLLRAFGETLSGRAYTDTVAQVAGSDSVTVFAGRLAQTRPELARELIQGQALIGGEGQSDKKQVVREALRSKLGGALYPSVEEQNTAIEAAKALYVARRGRGNALYEEPDQAALEKAIEEVTGPIVKRNGARVPGVPGMTASQFSGVLNGLDREGLDLMGGARDARGHILSPRTVRDYAILKPFTVGGHRYAVGMADPRAPDGFAPLFTKDFEPLVFDIRALAARKPVDRGPRGSARPRAQELDGPPP